MTKGLIAIYSSLILFAAIHFLLSGTGQTERAMMATFLGGSAMILMTWAIWLSTRPKWLEDWFGGLDKIYQAHKFIGVTILLLILIHFFAIPKLETAERLPQVGLAAITGWLGSPVGMISMILIILSIVISLNRKIPYHIWIKPHRLMGLLYIGIFIHMLLSPIELFNGKSASGMVLFLVGLFGTGTYIYRQLTRGKRATAYKLTAINQLERATELILSPTSGQKMDFKSGQFGFLSLDQKGFDEPHPFTISSAPQEDDLRFTVKVLGDFTRRVRDQLKLGTTAKIEGPYGRFDMQIANKNQIWVAGGVGITPFLSAMRDMQMDDERNITLFYCVQEKNQALFLDEFQAKFSDAPNRQLVILESNQKQFATIEAIKQQVNEDLSNFDIFLCGPKPMVDGLTKSLKKANISSAKIHKEAFEFR